MVRVTITSMAKATMRAIQVKEFGPPSVLRVDCDVPIPSCSTTQAVIRIMAAGVNPVETYIRSGTHLIKPPLPYTPGNDAAGIIESLGEGVTKFKKGDRVFCARKNVTGTYAEYCLAEQNSIWPLDERLTFSQGAAIGAPYFTAYRALIQKCKAKASQSVLVHGASGAVGMAAVQLARAYGMTVYGTAGTPEGIEIVKMTGAHATFNHREHDYVDGIMEATQGKGVNVILEMLSNVNLQKDLTMVSPNGVIGVIGCRGQIEINPRLLMTKESSVIGVQLGTATQADWEEMGSALLPGLAQGWLTPVVDREYSLEQAAQAHHDIIESSGAKGKLVLKVASQ